MSKQQPQQKVIVRISRDLDLICFLTDVISMVAGKVSLHYLVAMWKRAPSSQSSLSCGM